MVLAAVVVGTVVDYIVDLCCRAEAPDIELVVADTAPVPIESAPAENSNTFPAEEAVVIVAVVV